MSIIFGTDGWRGKIGREFTDENLLLVSQTICDYLKDQDLKNNFIIVGFDNRFRSEEYAETVANLFSANGFQVILSTEPVSTPVVSFVTNRFKAALGLCVTASHNPPYYNGLKIKENFGGSALNSTIDGIKPYLQNAKPVIGNDRNVTRVDLKVEYISNLKKMFDIDKIANYFNEHLIHLNYMHGSSSGYFRQIFSELYVPIMEYSLNRDVLFGGVNPEPIPNNLTDFINCVYKGVGFAFDGDGDRIAGVLPNSRFVSSGQLLSCLVPYLTYKSNANKAVFTVSCSDLPSKVAKSVGLDVEITKIGFKHIADKMINGDPVLIGGEESGGIGFIGYIPERDGIAVALLVLEMIATARMPLGVILDDLEEEFGTHIQDRVDLTVKNPQLTLDKIKNLERSPELLIKSTTNVDSTDGVKIIVPGGWFMVRQSGTEPVVRVYAESDSIEKTQLLIKRASEFILA